MDRFQDLLFEQNELHTIYDYIKNGDELSNDMLEKLSNLCSDRMYEIDGQLDYLEFEAEHGTGVLNDDGTMMTLEELDAHVKEL
ncbi:hypothetical protein [Bacillus sp. ISL-7]|uniref:hypothetical protein n=1 Tax=Bacillus sp. ISL-7 TaxID=2819136 RepID=UPI001BEB6DA4|nr:hypothetical protein [Bacillus sp. ISL-7]MBT2736154.1 hypothetical protein [Bacillus sp. ISL-7]